MTYPKTHDIVAYTYRADIYCPDCIVRTVMIRTQTPIESVDNSGNPVNGAENSLDELAAELDIDREYEAQFDGDTFPKVVFRDQLADATDDAYPETCGQCGQNLKEN